MYGHIYFNDIFRQTNIFRNKSSPHWMKHCRFALNHPYILESLCPFLEKLYSKSPLKEPNSILWYDPVDLQSKERNFNAQATMDQSTLVLLWSISWIEAPLKTRLLLRLISMALGTLPAHHISCSSLGLILVYLSHGGAPVLKIA